MSEGIVRNTTTYRHGNPVPASDASYNSNPIPAENASLNSNPVPVADATFNSNPITVLPNPANFGNPVTLP